MEILLAMLLVVSVAVNVVLGIGFKNSVKLNRDYEEFIVTIGDRMQEAYERLKIVDLNGAFESDDEVGFVFDYLYQNIQDLNQAFNPEENYEEKEKERLEGIS